MRNCGLNKRWHFRKLAVMLGMTNEAGKKPISDQCQLLKQKRGHKEIVVRNVDISKMRVIGRGNESVYLYYFPTYEISSILYSKYVDDSHETPIYRCKIGKTKGDPKKRVSKQIGQQLPEKARIALVIKTDNCEALETEIHDELKRRRCWLDPKSGDDVVGEEWFWTNPAQVEGIFKSIHRTANSNE